MTRWVILGVLIAATARAAAPVQIFPGYGGWTSLGVPAANTLHCVTLPAQFTMTATKLAGRVAVGVGGSTTGFAIYPNSDGGSELGEAFGSSAAQGTISATGLSISLTAGTQYRICFCSTSASVFILGLDGGGGGGRMLAILNGVLTTSAGTAANACVTGDPPATTGALTGATNFSIPWVQVE